MAKDVTILPLILLILLGFLFSMSSSASSSSSKILSSLTSEAVSTIVKWFQSLKSTTKTGTSARSMMKFESGYTVQTVFDGSKLGIEPYSVKILPGGELLILDSSNSNIYKISASLTPKSRPRLIAGSTDGISGHVDGRLRESRMNHPKGITVDDRGNIYVADALNMAIRKISSSGVSTVAGGRTGRGGGQADGPSEEAKFSDDFDVVYIGSSCSLLVVDRGNHAIREIQLRFDDCVYQHQTGFPLGVAILIAAGLCGYMIASVCASGRPVKPARPPLMSTEGEGEKLEEGLFTSLCNLMLSAGVALAEIVGGILPVSRRRYEAKRVDPWPAQESYEIPAEEVPPPGDTRTPTPQKTYAFMTKDAERIEQQSDAIWREWQSGVRKEQHRHRHYYRHCSSQARTVYELPAEEPNRVVFWEGPEVGYGGCFSFPWSYMGYDCY